MTRQTHPQPVPARRPAHGRGARTASQLLAAAGGTIALASPALAQVAGERVAAGSATFQRAGNVTTITAANNTIINYSSFNIRPGEAVRFVQPDALARVLNRINSALPSRIDGELSANGRVYIVNPAGVYFGRGAMINVGGIFAAAAHVNDGEFLRGVDRFRTTAGGKVVNEGTIHADVVGLIGREVFNLGAIEAPQGTIAMVSGDTVTLGEQGGRVFAQIEKPVDMGPHAPGTPKAPTRARFGAGDMFGVAVWNKGTARAARVHMESQRGQTRVEGSVDASNAAGKGGEIKALGRTVAVVGADLNASGADGGGTVLVGGNFQGEGPERNAQRTLVDADSTIRADATRRGDGGKVIVWADDHTSFRGALSAKGGPEGGDGGFGEISGKNTLDANTNVDLSAPHGRTGTVLYDPQNIEIRGGTNDGSDDPDSQTDRVRADTTTGEVAFDDEGDGFVVDGGNDDPFVIFESEIEGTNADIVLQARQSITTSGDFANDDVLVTSGRSLTLQTRNSNADGAGSIDLTGSTDGTNLEFRTQGAGSISILSATSGEAGGGITLGKLRSDTGSISINAGGPADTVTLTNSLTTAGGGISFAGAPVLLSTNVTMTTGAGAGDITFDGSSTVDSLTATARNLNLTAGTGAVSFGADVGSNFQLGTLTISSASGGVTAQGIRASSVAISDGGNVDLNGAVTANGGFSAGGTGTFDNTGAPIAVSNNPLTLTFSNAVTLGAALSTSGGAIDITGSAVTSSSTLSSGAGTISLAASEIDLGAAGSVSGTGQMIFRPGSAAQAVTIGDAGATAGLDVSPTDIAALAEGFSSIIIGRGDGQHAITVAGASSFKDAVLIQAPAGAGSITTSAALDTAASTNAAAITLSTAGSVNLNGSVASANGAIAVTGNTVATTSTLNSGTAATTLTATNGVTVGGAVTANGGFTSSGTTFDNTGGAIAVSSNPLTLTFSDAIVLGAALSSGGGTLSVTSTGGNISAGASVNSGGGTLTLDAGTSTLTVSSTVAAGSGTLNLTGGEIDLTGGGATVSGTGQAIFRPGTTTQAIRVGDAADTGAPLDLTATDLAALAEGFSTVVIGRGNGAHAITVAGASSFKDAVQIQSPSGAGSITLSAALDTLASTAAAGITLNTAGAATLGGSLTTGGGAITVTGATVATSAAIASGAGAITLTADEIDLGASVSGTSTLTLQPVTTTLLMNVGGAVAVGGRLNLLATDLAQLQEGFSRVTIGRSNSSGNIAVSATGASFLDTVELRTPSGGAIAINGALTTASSANTANVLLSAGAGATQAAGILTDGLTLSGTGAFLLNSAANAFDSASGTVTGSITLRNSTAFSAGTGGSPLTASGAGNDISLTSDAGDITLGAVSAADVATISSAGSVLDDASGATSLAAATATITAAGSIGAASGGELETSLGALTATTTDGQIAIAEANGLTLTSVTAGGAGRNITVTSATGDITVADVTAAGDSVTITANGVSATDGSILDDANDTTFIVGSSISLTSNHNIGATPVDDGNRDIGAVDLDAATISLAALNSDINVYINGPAQIGVGSPLTASGFIKLVAADDITAGAVDAGTKITLISQTGDILDDNDNTTLLDAISLNLIALSGRIGTDTGVTPDGEMDLSFTSLLDAQSGDTGFFSRLFNQGASSRTCILRTVDASGVGAVIEMDVDTVTGTGAVGIRADSVSATTAITISNTRGGLTDDASNSTRITAPTLTLLASGGIGTSGTNNELDTDTATLDAQATTAGGVFIGELDGLTITNALAAAGDVQVSAAGALVATNVAATGGSVSLSTTSGGMTLTSVTAGGSGTNNVTATATTGDIAVVTVAADDSATISATAGAVTNDASTATRITAATASITAGNGSVGASGDRLDVDAATASASATNGSVFLATYQDTTLASVSAAGTGVNDVDVLSSGATGLTATSVTAEDSLTLNSGAGLTLGGLSAGTTASLTAAGSITNDANASNEVSAPDATLSAGGAIGTSGSRIDTRFDTLTATAGNGGVFLREANGLTLTSVTSTGGTNAVNIVSTTGSITVVEVTAAGTATLQASAGSILDDGSNATLITGTGATLTAGNGSVGTTTGLFEIDLSVPTLAASAIGGSVVVHNDGALAVTSIVASGSGTNNVTVTNGSGNITVGDFNADDTVNVTSAAAILDDADSDTSVGGTTVNLTALNGGIGAANAVETSAGTLNASATGGTMRIDEFDHIVLASVTASGAGVNDIEIAASGTVTVETVTADDAIDITGAEVLDDGVNATTIAGAGVSITAFNGSIGSTAGNGQIDTDTAAATLSATGGSVVVRNVGALQLDSASATGNGVNNITVTTQTGDLTLVAATAEDAATFTSTAGSILDDGDTGAGATRIVAGTLSLNAATEIGAAGAAAVDTDATSLSAVATAGSVFIEELTGVVLSTVTAGAVGGQADIRAQSMTDDGVNSTVVAGDTVTLFASDGSIGASGATGQIDTQAGAITLSSTNGSVFVTDVDSLSVTGATAAGTGTNNVTVVATTGDLTIDTVAADDAATLTASAGSIIDDGSNTSRISAATVTLSAANGSIGASGAGNEIDTAAGTLSAAATNGSVFIDELDAVTITSITATGTGVNDATVANTSGNIVLGAATVDNTLTVTSAGAIEDDGTAAQLAAADALLTAATSIGASATPLGTSFGTLSAAAGAGGIFILEANAITLTTLTAAGAGSDIVVTAQAGGIEVHTVTATDDVTLTATAGAITDDGVDGTAISGDALTLAAAGSIGATGALNALDTSVSSISATATGGSIFVNESDSVTLTSLTATGAGQDVSVIAGGDITVASLSAPDAVTLDANGAGADILDDGSNGTAITAASAALTADGAIGAAGATAGMDTAITSLTAAAADGGVFITESDGITLTNISAAGAGNAVTVTSATGNIAVNTVTAPGAVTLTATAGSITDDGADGTLITALSATLTAAASIGTSTGSAQIDTAVSSLDVSSTSAGQIAIANTGAVTLTDVDTANGAISVTATGDLTATDVQAGGAGAITLASSGGSAFIGSISTTGDASVTATNGAIAEIGAGDSATDIAAADLTLTARNAIGGAGEADIETAVNTLNASSTNSGGITVQESNGITLASVTTTSGNVSVISGGQMTASSVVAGGGGTVTLSAASGDLRVDSVAAGGAATLTASTGSILEITGDAGVDVAAPTVTLTSGGTVGVAGTSFDVATATLTATAAGDINISETDSVAVGGLTAANGDVTLGTGGTVTIAGPVSAGSSGSVLVLSGGAIAVNADVSAGSGVILRASSGAGNISFGPGDVDITANTIELNAGNGPGGTPSTATVNARTNSPEFRPASGSRITTMTIQQGPQLADALLPTLGQFLSSPPLNYRLVSEDAGITISTASLVNGTHLNLTGGPVQILPDIDVLSLTTTGATVSVRGVRATAGDITLGGAATITGGELNAGTGTIDLQSTLAGASGVPVTLIADEIELAGAVSGNSALTLMPGSGLLDVFVGAATDPGSGLWLSQAEINRFQNGFASVTIGNPFGFGALDVIGPVSFADPVTLQMPDGDATVRALITGTNDASITLTSPRVAFTGSGGVRSTGRAIRVNGEVVIGNALSLDSTGNGLSGAGAEVRVTGAIEGDGAAARSLTATSGFAGGSIFDQPIGASNALDTVTLTGATLDLNGVRTSGAQLLTGATTLRAGLSSLAGGGITITGATTLTGANISIITAGAASDSILLAGPVSSEIGTARSLTLNAGAGSVAITGDAGASFPLASLTVQASAISVAAVTTTGLQTYTGAATLNGDLTSTGPGVISINGPATLAAPSIAIQTAGSAADDVSFGAAVDGASNLTIDVGAGDVTFGGDVGALTPLASLSSTAQNASLRAVTTAGDQSYTGTAVLNGSLATTSGGDITVTGSTFVVPAALGISAGGAGAGINLAGTLDGATDVTLIASDGVRLGGAAGAGIVLNSLSITGTTIDVSAVTTAGAQSLLGNATLRGDLTSANGPIALSGASTLAVPAVSISAGGTASTISLSGSLDGDSDVTLNAAQVSLGSLGAPAPIGQSTALRSINVNAPIIGVGPARTTGNQNYNGTTFTFGALSAVGSGSINITAASALGGDLTTAGGTISLDGPVSLTAPVTASSNGGGIAFASTVDGAHALSAQAGTGSVTFAADIGQTTQLASLSAGGAQVIVPAAVNTAGSQTYTGPIVLTQTATSLTAAAGPITLDGDVTGADLTLSSEDSTSTITGNASLTSLIVRGPAALGNDAAPVTIAATNGVTFASTTTLLGDTTISSDLGRLYFMGHIASGGGTPRALTLRSGLLPSIVAGDGQIISTVPFIFGGDVGGDGEASLASLSLGGALDDIPETSSIVFTNLDVNADGNFVLPPDFVLPDVQVAGEAALLPTFRVNANSFDMGENQKITAFGNLEINAGAGTVTLGDLTSLGDITVNAGEIFLRPRFGSRVLTNLFDGIPPDPGTVDDDGLDFIARDSITFSVPPLFTTTGNARFATNTGQGLRLETGGFINNLFVQGVVFEGGVSNKLLTPRTPAGTPVAGFENTGIALDLSSNSVNVSNIASALASAVPSAQSAVVDTGTITLSSNVRKALEELGVFTKDPVNIDDGLVEAAVEGLSGSTLFSDYPDKAVITDSDIIKITPNRLTQESVDAALAAYGRLVGPPDATRPDRVAKMQDEMDLLWLEYTDALGEAEPVPAEFVEFVRAHPDGAPVLETLQKIRDLLAALDNMALTEVEIRRPKQDVLTYVRPSGMTVEQLEAAAMTLAPVTVQPLVIPAPATTDTPQPAPSDEPLPVMPDGMPHSDEPLPVDQEDPSEPLPIPQPKPQTEPLPETGPEEEPLPVQPAEEPKKPQPVGAK